MRAAAALLLFGALLSQPARATPQTFDLDFKPPLGVPLLSVGLLGTLVPELVKDHLAPQRCRWCHATGDGAVSVNGFDRAVRDGLTGALVSPSSWKTWSDVLTFGLIPGLAIASDLFLAHGGRPSLEWGTDVVIVTEAVLLAMAVGQAVKLIAGRERPFVAYDPPYASRLRSGTEGAADDHLSFFSGHTLIATTVATAMGRVIELRTGSRLGYLLLVPLGVLAGVMRVGADKHWGTDILAGLAVGLGAGYLIPTLHARPHER